MANAPRNNLFQLCAWVIGCALMADLFFGDVITFHGGYISNNNFFGRDFVNVWTGGLAVRHGHSEILNNVSDYVTYQRSLFGNIDNHNYSYPPLSYPLAATFSLLPYWAALIAWLGSTGALFILACRKWWPAKSGPVWLAALTPAALMNVWDGQYGALIGALYLLGWQWLDRHPRRAGLAFGLMLLKPHLAVMVPVALLMRRQWLAAAAAGATIAASISGTVMFFGWQAWWDYLVHTGPMQASMVASRGTFFSFQSTSIITALVNLGASTMAATIAQVLVAAVATGMVCVAAYKKTPTKELAFLTGTCTFLVLPYAFNYDLTVVAMGAILLMATSGTHELERMAACFGLICAPAGLYLAALGFPITPLFLGGLAAAQYHRWVVCRPNCLHVSANPSITTMPLAA